MSAHNSPADKMTRWSDEEAEQWSQQEGMSGIDASWALWKSMDFAYNASPLIANPPNTFNMLSLALRFFGPYNHRVCEWMPSIYSVESVLGPWGLPVF